MVRDRGWAAGEGSRSWAARIGGSAGEPSRFLADGSEGGVLSRNSWKKLLHPLPFLFSGESRGRSGG